MVFLSDPSSLDEERSAADSVVTVGGRATLPTVYMADETHTRAQRGQQLRFRNTSQEEGGNGSSVTSPSYGTPGSFTSLMSPPDSGVEVDESFMRHPDGDSSARDDSGFRYIPSRKSKLLQSSPIYPSTHEGSYIAPPPKYNFKEQAAFDCDDESSSDTLRRFFGFRQRRRKHALFDNDPSFAVEAAIPVVVILVVLACCVFTVLTLSAGMRKMPEELRKSVEEVAAGGRRGRYAAMEFAVNRKFEKLREEGKLLPEDVSVDDEGNPIGGKRAAIQYAYELLRRSEEGYEGAEPEFEAKAVDVDQVVEPVDDDQDEIENLEALSQLLEVKESDSEQMAEKRRELIAKIGSFGHFASTKVAPPTEEQEQPEEADKEEEYDDEEDVQDEEEVEEEEVKPEVVASKKALPVVSPKSLPAPVLVENDLQAITQAILDGKIKHEDEEEVQRPKKVKKSKKEKRAKRTPAQSRRDNPFRKRTQNSREGFRKSEDAINVEK